MLKKDEFIGIASHELKTPITTIKAYTQLLSRYFGDTNDKKVLTYLSRMNTQVDKLTTLIYDLLDISKINAGKLQLNCDIFEIGNFLAEMIHDISEMNKHNTIIYQGNVHCKVYADRYRIEQVITNILSNAIKYSPPHTPVYVNATCDSSEIILSITDFGIGIPKNRQKRIFEKFYRADGRKRESYPGLGLGLYISAEIIKRHNGKIWVESKEGKGTTCYVSLPILMRHQLRKYTRYHTYAEPPNKTYMDHR